MSNSKILNYIKLVLNPEISIPSEEIKLIYKEKVKNEFIVSSKLTLFLGSFLFLIHIWIFDIPMNLQPIEKWIAMRVVVSLILLICGLFYLNKQFCESRFFRYPFFISLTLVTYLESYFTIVWQEMEYMYSFLFALVTTLLLRLPLGKSLIVSIFLIFIISQNLIIANVSTSSILSASILTLFGLIVFKIRDLNEIKFIIANEELKKSKQDRIDSERKFLASFKSKTKQVAHDLKSPLTVLKMLSYKLNKDENQKLYAELLDNTYSKLMKIVDDLPIDNFKDEKIEAVFLDVFLANILNQKKIEYPDCDFRFNNCLSEPFKIKIMVTSFDRVISNILNNAYEAYSDTHKNPIVNIHIRRKDSLFEIEIEDFGKGIPENNFNKIFNEGFSDGKTNRQVKVSGLGLSHAKEVVELIGGKLSISSKVEVGTKVCILLPI